MITAWTQHLPSEKKENFERQVRQAVDVLDRLRDICQEELNQLDKDESSFTPGWEYKMAGIVSDRKRLRWLLKLLDHRG